jgi:S1-C subfamily serine protease
MKRLHSALLLTWIVVSALSRSAWGGAPLVRAQTTTLEALLQMRPGERLGWDPSPRADALPNFSKEPLPTRGEVPPASAMREATVILGTPDGGFGSGVILSPDGWILTNYHVVATTAQLAAQTGGPAKMRVFYGKKKSDGSMQLAPDTLFAQVYRVSPVVDLALLKMEGLGKRTFPSVHLATHSVEAGSECFVIGSQGAGFPWLFRSGKVLGIFDYPTGITEVMIHADTLGAAFERTRLTIAISDCPISPGDSGGPLLDRQGNLIGLTFATPANLSSGSMGLHVSLSEIRRFVEHMPTAPEGIPFDPWVAGLPFSVHTAPQAGILQEQGKPCFVLQYMYLSQQQQPLAEMLFFDLNAHNGVQVVGADTVFSVLPAGIWGMEERKGFAFDTFLTRRFDGLVAVGYTDQNHIVNEIRLDANQDGNADVVWTRAANATWQSSTAAAPLLDANRLGERGMTVLGQALGKKG